MFKKILGLTMSAPFMLCGSAFAGEFGVTNSYNQGWRAGTGSSWSAYTANIQQTENYNFLSAKLDCSYYGGGSGYDAASDSGSGIFEVISSNGGGSNGNNGFGNGDQDAPGGSGPHNNAENAGGGGNSGGSSSNTNTATQTPSGFNGAANTATGGGADYSVRSIAFAMTSGTGTRTEDTNVIGGSQEVYSFGSSSFDHSVSSFAR
jgi:hypothetical protein